METGASFTTPVTFTADALAEVKRLYHESGSAVGKGLRVGVKGGGCSGFSYVLEFDTKGSMDEEYEVEGLKVFMNKAHRIYLEGMIIDYKDGLDARGFIFHNPNATKTCGCGSSFAA
ncbi:MAG: iron-sulfur-binding protein [Chitinophagales bacterium]|nr:MAG: iron-sulfur-binding protein [Chitinophagales bacterium]